MNSKPIDWNILGFDAHLVNCLGIVFNPKTKKILIARRENDPLIKELTWVFPGGNTMLNKRLEEHLVEELKRKTNLDVEVKQLIHSRILPEHQRILNLYYYAEVKTIGKEKASGSLKELKWINPSDFKKHATTLVDEKVEKFLKQLEKK
ncbi:MAG: NUDIX domain-containing protein [archaeon]|nr:NUDIX domain-containing protein [archaeon]